MAVSEGNGSTPAMCDCQIRETRGIVADDEINWAVWLGLDRDRAATALRFLAQKNPERMRQILEHTSAGIHAIEMNCLAPPFCEVIGPG